MKAEEFLLNKHIMIISQNIVVADRIMIKTWNIYYLFQGTVTINFTTIL